MIKPWTSEEIEKLTALFPNLPTPELVKQFDRRLGALRSKAFALGLRKPQGFVAPHPRKWAEEEIDKLQELFPTTTFENLAEAIGKPISAVISKCYSLGLKKSAEYRKAYLASNREQARKVQLGKEPWNKGPKATICCKWCKQNFDVIPARRDRAIFCKRACMTAWRKTIVGDAHWLYTQVERTCKWCNNAFRTKQAKVNYGEGHYCSRSCMGSATSYKLGQQKGPTSIEVKMEQALQSRGITYIPQHGIGPWCVDFFLPDHNMIIECDGDYWHSIDKVKRRDNRKNGYLKHHGYTMHRITETDINTKLDEALLNILPLAA